MNTLVGLFYLLTNLIFAPNMINKIINKDVIVKGFYQESDLKFIKIKMDDREILLLLPKEVITNNVNGFEWQELIKSFSKQIKINCNISVDKLWNKELTFTLIKING
tara:strand:+ start:114 stop:434 length:321 start_codon:yes stop_codon:yes gene_type:complete